MRNVAFEVRVQNIEPLHNAGFRNSGDHKDRPYKNQFYCKS